MPPNSMYVKSQANTQTALNNIVCNVNIAGDANVRTTCQLNRTGTLYANSWGVSTTGVLYFSPESVYNVDPFYPQAYGSISTSAGAIEQIDACLAHPQSAGIYHYHVASPCIANASLGGLGNGSLTVDPKTWMMQQWKAVPFRTAIGISKDGYPIYSPYFGNGQVYSDCMVDTCNGFNVSG